MSTLEETIQDFVTFTSGKKYKTIYADPPWLFKNHTGKIGPEHKRLHRYSTMPLEDIKSIPVNDVADDKCHLYLWIPNALLLDGLEVMKSWGFTYTSNLIWEKVSSNGQPDGRCMGFYFRNVTEMLLFGVKGKNNRTLDPGRSQVNLIRSIKREHSRKPYEFVDLIQRCSPGPYLEMFARGNRDGWDMWGNQATDDYAPDWSTQDNRIGSVKQRKIFTI